MKETMKQIGWQVALTITVIVIAALDYAIADTFGWTVNGMSYMEYTKWYFCNHPFMVGLEGLVIGWLIGNFDIR